MLPDPDAVPDHATVQAVGCALLAMWAEVRTEVAMLRRSGWGHDVWEPLLLINLLTWSCLFFAPDKVKALGLSPAWMITLLEAAIIVVEAALIWTALRFRPRVDARPAVTLLRALAVSFVGNLVSVLVMVSLT